MNNMKSEQVMYIPSRLDVCNNELSRIRLLAIDAVTNWKFREAESYAHEAIKYIEELEEMYEERVAEGMEEM